MKNRVCKYIILLFYVNFIYSSCNEGFVNINDGGEQPDCVPAEFIYNNSTALGYYIFDEVTFKGNEVTSDYWVGAFNGDVCVGSRRWDTQSCSNGDCDLPIFGNDGSEWTEGYMNYGDIPTFKIFQTASQSYFEAFSSLNQPWAPLISAFLPILYSCGDSHDWDFDGICDHVDNCVGTEENNGNCLSTENPLNFNLKQNYPNPFNPFTIIEFSLQKSNFIEINIFDLGGNKVKNLLSNFLTEGNYKITWDGTDDKSIKLPSSSYLLSLSTESEILTKKVTLIK